MEDFKTIFAKLRMNLSSLKKGIVVKKDTGKVYYLETNIEYRDKPMFFGAVVIHKSYVSYHLIPVYTNPALLKGISPELKKRMQGKSCFNFKKVNEKLFKEIGELTKKGYASFKKQGFIK